MSETRVSNFLLQTTYRTHISGSWRVMGLAKRLHCAERQTHVLREYSIAQEKREK